MKIHIFNPENDMALADGTPGYTPPANIRAYRKANWRLPEQWAEAGDVVWDGESSLADYFRNIENKKSGNLEKHIKECLISEVPDFLKSEIPELAPWGWSKALVHQLEMAGVPRNVMPSDEWLDKLRMLSSRVSTVKIQQQLGVEAHVCHTLQELKETLSARRFATLSQSEATERTPNSELLTNGKAVLKSPWSSSGKGLMFLDNPNWQGWVNRILKLQGAVIAERLLPRRQDFAMEFRMKCGRAEYTGLSVFNTDERGHYINNVKASEEEKTAMLTSLDSELPKSLNSELSKSLNSTREWFVENLPLIAPWYEGPVGVDMLITRDGRLCPCVEINWRRTMGMI